MTEQEEVEAMVNTLIADFATPIHHAAREILLLRKQEIYLEGQNADLRKRVAELESIARQYEFERLRK